MHVCLDIETLGTKADTVILTLGAVKFDPYSRQDPHTPLYVKLDVDEQVAAGRTIDEGTLVWWELQPKEVFEDAMSDEDRISCKEFTKQLNRYLVGAERIWTQGPTFDIILLEHLYRSLEIPVPWMYYSIRDTRTIMDMGDASAKKNNATAHNALADAYSQAVMVQQIYHQCGVVKK
jgi:hypothetical protein